MKINIIFNEAAVELQKSDICVSGIAESADSFFIRDIYEKSAGNGGIVIVLAEDAKNAERICNEINSLSPDLAKLFPQAHNIPYNMRSIFGPIREQRLIVLDEILNGKAKIVVMPVSTIFEKVAPPEKLFNSVVNLVAGEDISQDFLTEKLTIAGFSRESSVTEPGQFSKRGGIFDIYAFGHENPIRIEFWGDTIDSIREFDIFKQRSIRVISQISILPMREFSPSVEERDEALVKIKKFCENNNIDKKHLDFIAHSWSVFNEIDGLEWFYNWFNFEQVCVLDYLPKETIIIHNDLFDFEKSYIREIANYEKHRDRVPEIVAPFVSSPENLLIAAAEIKEKMNFKQCFVNTPNKNDLPYFNLDFVNQPSFGGDFPLFVNDFNHKLGMGFDITIFAENDGFANRLREMLEEQNVKIPKIEIGFVCSGFLSLRNKVCFYSDRNIFDRATSKKIAIKTAKRASRAAISFDRLSRGDIVVHVDHGIGKYLGTEKLNIGDVEQDCLLIEYKNNAKLRVPIIDYYKIQKYIGKDGIVPELSTLGSSAWQKKKDRTRAALQEMAGKMVKLYAKREFNEGLFFTPDNKWQHEFEDSFEYEPTNDQITTIEQIKRDLEAPKPMDRLVCGDVGFGKTEVAMRAAFKAVMSGFQVAILAPTTVLASQHAKTFKERMKEFPVKIEELSRLVDSSQVRKTKEKLKNGEVDILVGTHKILSKDIVFKNLGLLVIDEEQRFGVKQKDLFANYRSAINVLSMSATPIPRTLHMSMAGIRDLSLINTPPRNRLSIETKVEQDHDEIVKNALENELERGGQAFVVMNRIEGLTDLHIRLERLVPKAKIAVAHGQMEGAEIERIMSNFVAGRYDILISTTIIENGIDIPNANTIIVERADLLGLSQLYQLRGRVGRSNEQAFAFFLVDDFRKVNPDSMKRLKAMEQYTDLGSGFQLAMRDLELRGAGNLLGTDQSGSISAIGFELYCQLLKEEIERLRNAESDIEQAIDTKMRLKIHGYFPSDYVSDTSLQIMLYQKCTSAKTIDELNDFENEIADRFGAIPEQVSELLLFIGIKILAGSLNIAELSVENNRLKLTLGGANEKIAKVCSQFTANEKAGFVIDYGIESVKLKCKLPEADDMEQAGIVFALLSDAKTDFFSIHKYK